MDQPDAVRSVFNRVTTFFTRKAEILYFFFSRMARLTTEVHSPSPGSSAACWSEAEIPFLRGCGGSTFAKGLGATPLKLSAARSGELR